MRVQLLGAPTFTTSEGDLSLPPKVRLLAACLFFHKGHCLPRSRLAALFWPEADEQRAATSLRNALHALQSALNRAGEGKLLQVTRDSVCVPESSPCDIDVHRFEADVQAVLSASAESDVSDLVGAITLYRGELLSGVDGNLSEVEAWYLPERERLRDMYTSALSTVVRYFCEADLSHAAVTYALRWRDADPLNEEASRFLMRLYAETGQPARVAEEFERCRKTLDEQLGVAPSELTVQTWKEKSRAALKRQPELPDHAGALSAPELSTDPMRNASLLTIFGEQKVVEGETDEGMEALHKAREIYTQLGDEEQECRARLTMAGALLNSRIAPRPDLAVAEVMPLLPLYRERGPSSDFGRALLIAADALQFCSAYEESAALAREGLELARSTGNRDLQTRLDLVRGLALTYQQEFDEATEALESAIAGLGRLYRPREMLRAMTARGVLAMLNETFAASEQYLLEAVSIASRLPRTPVTVFAEGYARGILIILYWGLDRHEDAKAIAFDSGFDLGSAPGGNVCQAICLPGEDPIASAKTAAQILRESLPTLGAWPAAGFSRILWQQLNLLGLHEDALRWSALNVRLSRHVKLKLYEGTGYSARGITLVHLGNLRAAEACLSRATALADREHGYSMAYLSHLQALIAREKGDLAEARRAFDEAMARWRQIGDCHFVSMISKDMAAMPEG